VHEISFFSALCVHFVFFSFRLPVAIFLLNHTQKTLKTKHPNRQNPLCVGESCVYTKPPKPNLKLLKNKNKKNKTKHHTEAGLISLTRLVQNGGGRSNNNNKGLNGIREEQHENQPPEPQQQQQQAHVAGRHAWALPFTNLAIGLTLPTCA
jgi:hypothetical protein